MIDTHAHLDFPEFDEDRDEVISRFFLQGGKAIINVGVDLETSKKSIELAEKHENILASVGFHPQSFSEQRSVISEQQKLFNDLKELAKRKKVVAIGETGLDYFRIGESGEIGKIRENQKKGFLAQIEIAKELQLPVVVHCREAWEDLYGIISDFNKSSAFPFQGLSSRNSSKPSFIKFVLHCYSGEKENTEKFLKLQNVYFSFSGNITYPPRKDSHPSAPAGHLPSGRGGGLIEEAIKMIPLDRIMLDSDSPFLAPQEFRGKRNEPGHIRFIAQKIAGIKGISGGEIEEVTDQNAITFFGI